MPTLTLLATLLPVGSAVVGVVLFFVDLRRDQKQLLAVGRELLKTAVQIKEALDHGARR